MDAEPVTYSRREYELGRRPSGTPIETTVHRYQGGSGPTVYVQAAQHGIELNGPVALSRLHETLRTAALAGTVVAVPVANPLAFDHRSYVAPAAYDARNANLNRVWPGDETGSIQQRMAARLWELVTEADAVIDVHTGTRAMLTHVRFTDRSPARALAMAFGTEHVLCDPTGGPSGLLRDAATDAGIPALTVELSNSRTVDHTAAELGVRGVTNVLRELSVLAGTPTTPATQRVLDNDREHVIASESGLFTPQPSIEVGDSVEAGERLGVIFAPDTFEERETVTTVDPGVVYSLGRGTVIEGERLAAIAAPR